MMPEIGGFRRAQIQQHVVDRPAQAANQLTFARRRPLKVHPPQRAAATIPGNARLNELSRQSVGPELLRARRARKEPALVRKTLKLHQRCTGKLESFES